MKESVYSCLAHYLNEAHKLLLPSEKDTLYMPRRRCFYYRGQTNADWDLIPSIARDELYKHYEFHLYNTIVSEYPEEFQNLPSTLDKLAKMQHFGIPTRLLDLTRNIMIAFYFACKDALDKEKTTNGKVFIIKALPNEVSSFDSDTASILSNFARMKPHNNDFDSLLIEQYKDPLKKKEEREKVLAEFNKQRYIKQLLHYIREEKPNFSSAICPTDLDNRVLLINAKKNNFRMKIQDGAFLLFGNKKGHKRSISDARTALSYEIQLSPAYKIPAFEIHELIIPSTDKSKIIEELNDFGYNRATIFGDLIGYSEYLGSQPQRALYW